MPKPVPMTKTEARRLLDLLALHNGIMSHAAITAKISEGTFYRRIAAARRLVGTDKVQQDNRVLDAVARKAASTRLAAEQSAADARNLSVELKEARQVNEALMAALALERKTKTAKLLTTKPTVRAGGDLVRVIIPDMHGVHADEPAVAACLADVKRLDPDEIILLGDLIDCGGFLAQHHVLGYVEECEYSYVDDIAAGNAFLDRLQQAAPRAKIHYLEGNHEARLDSWCVMSALRNAKDSAMLRQAFHPEFMLKLAERGITYYARGTYHQGLRTAGIIRLGKCYFCHGFGHGTHAAADHVRRIGGPVVFGHIHRIQSYGQALVASGESAGWSVGCLSKFRRRYMHCQPHDWQHGYGLQLVRRDTGTFQHTTVHIIDGQSFLYDLNQRIGKES